MVSILSLEAEGHGASSKGSPHTAVVLREDGIIDWRKLTCLSGESRWIELEMALVCLFSSLLLCYVLLYFVLPSVLYSVLFPSVSLFCSAPLTERGHN